MKTKDVKVGMKFAAMDGCQFEVVRVHRDEMQVLWFGGNGEEAAPCDHNKVFPVRGPDSEFTLWTSSSTPCTLLNPEQFQEPAVTQTKPLPKFKHTVEITTTRTADDLERSLTGDAYTAKVVKSEQLREPFPAGHKYRHSPEGPIYEVRHYDAELDVYFVKAKSDGLPGWDTGMAVRTAKEVK